MDRRATSDHVTIMAVAIALAASVGTAWYGGRFQALRPRSRAQRATAGEERRKLSPYVTSIAILIAAAAMVQARLFNIAFRSQPQRLPQP